MVGQHQGDFTVVPHQCSWKGEFAPEADLLRRALAGNALRMGHVSSTAIPGMGASAIIAGVAAVVSLFIYIKFPNYPAVF